MLFLTYSHMCMGKQAKRSTFLDEMIKGKGKEIGT